MREARLGGCVPHRCGGEAHSKLYIPVSSSGIQLLLERPLLTTGSHLYSSTPSWGPTQREKSNGSSFAPQNNCWPRESWFLTQIVPPLLKFWSLNQWQSPGEGHVCWQLYRIIHSDMWRAVGVQVQAVACAFPTPQRRRPDHPCCACGDHKTLTRMCVKCNIVQRFYLVWGASSLFLLYFDFLSGSSTLCVLLLCYPCSVHSLKSQANGEFSPYRGWETQACNVYGLEERSSLSCDYLWDESVHVL